MATGGCGGSGDSREYWFGVRWLLHGLSYRFHGFGLPSLTRHRNRGCSGVSGFNISPGRRVGSPQKRTSVQEQGPLAAEAADCRAQSGPRDSCAIPPSPLFSQSQGRPIRRRWGWKRLHDGLRPAPINLACCEYSRIIRPGVQAILITIPRVDDCQLAVQMLESVAGGLIGSGEHVIILHFIGEDDERWVVESWRSMASVVLLFRSAAAAAVFILS